MTDFWTVDDVIPLNYTRIVNGAPVSGLTVTVTVYNRNTNATLLSSTSCPETATGSGVYLYSWTHGLTKDTNLRAVYTVGSRSVPEDITVLASAPGGRAI